MVRLPDGDERARLQDLAEAHQGQPEDRQAKALDPVEHVDSLPQHSAIAITAAAEATPHEHQPKGDHGDGDRAHPERIELRKRGHGIHPLQVHVKARDRSCDKRRHRSSHGCPAGSGTKRCSRSAVAASAGKNASIASSERVTSTGVPKTIVVPINESVPCSVWRRSGTATDVKPKSKTG